MQAALANNIVKRQTMMIVLSLANKDMALPILGFLILPYKTKLKIITRFLENYTRNADYIMEQVYLKDRFMTPCAQEIKKILTATLTNSGINSILSEKTARVFSHMIEYDDAYRYRIEDIASETRAMWIKDKPRQEIKRLLRIHSEREIVHKENLRRKFRAFGNMLSLLMLFSPKIKKAFTDSLCPDTFKYLQFDEADRYHCLLRDDYQFEGRPLADRVAEYEKLHNGKYPPVIKYQN